MGANYNRVLIAGNLTRDPELRYIASGTAVTDLGIAITEKRKNATGEMVEDTVFVDVTLWARQAEVACEYLKKGSNVLIEGRLKFDTWETDGQKRSKLRVVGERMQMLGSKSGGGGGGGGGRADYDASEYSQPADEFSGSRGGAKDDDIPF